MKYVLYFLAFACMPLYGQMLRYGSVTDVDGNVYQTVFIGDEEWMAENLKVTKLNDGTEIPLVADHGEWTAIRTAAYCWYENDESNAPVYGALYNWYAVSTEKLCPEGWRVASDRGWQDLEATVDSRYGEGDPEWERPALMRGFDSAEKLKSVSGWKQDGNGSDSYGFRALPGGERRASDGSCFQLGAGGFWWTSTEADASFAWFRSMAYSYRQVARNSHDKNFGFSVRCIRSTRNPDPDYP